MIDYAEAAIEMHGVKDLNAQGANVIVVLPLEGIALTAAARLVPDPGYEPGRPRPLD